VIGFALTPANAPEREAAEGLLADHAGQYVLGDNGYSGERFREAVALRTCFNSCLRAPSGPDALQIAPDLGP
jgi:IS5 family transposase